MLKVVKVLWISLWHRNFVGQIFHIQFTTNFQIMMKKLFLSLAITLSFLTAGSAQQDYQTAIGLRLGYPWSASFKHFLSEKGAVEAFAGFRGYSGYRWVNLGATYQHHSPIQSVEGLKWFAGGGASAFFWSYNNNFLGLNDDYANVTFGILGIVGLDYKFADVPLNVSLDWMPAFFIGNGYTTGIGFGYGALSARYVLK
jgi:hypothetical protein